MVGPTVERSKSMPQETDQERDLSDIVVEADGVSPDAWAEQHRPFVISICQKLIAQLTLPIPMDDMISYGFQGLYEAKERYDPSRGVQFNTFAYYRIRGAMMDGLRSMTSLSRRLHEQLRTAKAMDDSAEQLGHTQAASPQEWTLKDQIKALAGVVEQTATAFVVAASTDPQNPEEQLVNQALAKEMENAVAALPEREQLLVRGFYFEGRRFDEVADSLGISKSWASRLHKKALDELKSVLGEDWEP